MTNDLQIKTDPSRLCIHTQTFRNLSIEQAVGLFSENNVRGISVWRHTLEGRDVRETGEMIRDAGLEVVSLVRGGFFASASLSARTSAVKDNIDAIEEARNLGAPLLILVCGADPAQSLSDSRNQIQAGIKALLPHAEKAGVRLAIEPLHPMYADTRSAVISLKQANDMAESLGSDYAGVAVDVYHLWWDQELEQEIARCGVMNKLLAFHVCDWKIPTEDMLEDRGLMGEGCINIKQIRSWIEGTGFEGYIEVEIFSRKYWAMDQEKYMEKILHAYAEHV